MDASSAVRRSAFIAAAAAGMEVAADLRPVLGPALVRLDPMRIKQLQVAQWICFTSRIRGFEGAPFPGEMPKTPPNQFSYLN
ncbi:unnamed protein product [Heligmosomoides polygyrus]|uniref:Oxidase n=1 Tax=Heligmosomoides polygyrus TaxID=6339 RepID=A0A183GTV9_HELPZ|nr:unnamed protein product [Heligmosomoides polygyrus]